MSARTKAYLALLATTIIWGFGPPIIKHALTFLKPLEFLFYRFLLVSIILLPFFVLSLKKQPFQLHDLPALFLVATCGTSLTLALYFTGLNKTTSLDAAVISATGPILIVLGGALFLKETVTFIEKVGLVLAFGGTLVAIVSPLLNGHQVLQPANAFGNFLVFLGNLTWAVYTLWGKKLFKKYSTFTITTLSFLVGLVTFLPLFLLHLATNPQAVTPQALLANPGLPGLLYMTFFGSFIAYFAYSYGVSLIEASEATLFTYLQPLFTAPLAVFWLKEPLNHSFLLGALLIGLGVFLTEYKPKARYQQTKARKQRD